MPRYFVKPIVWNDNEYKRPGGGKFNTGYPAEHGFGHEEWINSDDLRFPEGNREYRAFFVTGLGNVPVDELAGDMYLFMIASHQKNQYLVGVAGGVTAVPSAKKRNELAKKLNLRDLWKQAWELPSVKERFERDAGAFRRWWSKQSSYTASWKCPSDMFLWLHKPLKLDPVKLTGRRNLVVMYASYQEIARNTALQILNSIPGEQNDVTALDTLKARCMCSESDLQTDLEEIKRSGLKETTREALIQARIGQGAFRRDVDQLWGGSCAVTGCGVREALRASHVKPWRAANNKERLDPQNGLLLVADLDALFDTGLISFDDDGHVLVSKDLPRNEWQKLRLPSQLRTAPGEAQRRYLKFHREYHRGRRFASPVLSWPFPSKTPSHHSSVQA